MARKETAEQRETRLAKRRAKYAAKPAMTLATNKRWADANLEKLRANRARWAEANPEKDRAAKQKHKDAKRAKDRAPTRPRPETCECCGGPPRGRGRTLHLDHCHTTGAFRGWLCAPCNMGVGLLGDNEQGLLRALAYLKRSTV